MFKPRVLLVACLPILLTFVAETASAGVTGGTVESIAGNRLVIRTGTEQRIRAFQVPPTAKILVGKDPVALTDLKPGTKVYVFTSTNGSIYKITSRKADPDPVRPPTGRPRSAEIKGVVQSVVGNRLVINDGTRLKTFLVPRSAKIEIEGGKPKPGETVYVYTSTSGTITKITSKRVTNADRVSSSPASRNEGADAKVTGWTQFRGPDRANRSAATGLLDEWPAGGPKVAWKADGLGQGYSGVSISDGRVFTMGTTQSEEQIIALDWKTSGRVLWRRRNGTVYNDGQGNGPRGTPSVVENLVFALGANGDLQCVDAERGEPIWRRSLLTDFAGNNITWGISESPLVDGNRVIVTPGGTQGTMVALDRADGRIVWRSVVPGTPQASYSSAIVCQVGPVRQYVNFTSKGVVAVEANKGTVLWADASSSNGTANCSAPLFFANHVFSASGYGTGGALLRLIPSQRSTAARLVYRAKEMQNHHGGMVFLDGYVYGTNDNLLICMDARDGRVIWRDRSVGKGSITYAEGHLYVVGEKGEIALVEATPAGYREKGRFRHVNRSQRPLWSHPVVHDGRLIVRDQDTLTMYDIRAEKG